MFDLIIDDGKKVISYCDAYLLELEELNKKLLEDKKNVLLDNLKLEYEEFQI
ncbi:MAG: hypothetical protein OdinLCB4_007360 [Candidatus Odinarchaeum yellowstonii]|uniref:Uncharacterized protein n=1 Tax=Odinarchaeota yellowstonii (strain LCB_4) TaxID=1841599 RepID=A0AAF0D259_ODILC|nr:MAG: hypothetical protein OdinLCB4_007360 [Candidatus Odinarchaeum yellowstonii]